MNSAIKVVDHLSLPLTKAFFNLKEAELYEEALRRGEAKLSNQGALTVSTAPYFGRCAEDRFIVKEESTQALINWGSINKPISEENFYKIRTRLIKYLDDKQGQNLPLYVQDTIAGADRSVSINVRIITEYAWHSLFMRNMLEAVNSRSALEAAAKGELDLNKYKPEYTIICAPSFKANPQEDATRSEVFILVNFKAKEVLIGGTAYAGEMKKSVFGILNFLLPGKGIMPMHCSANADADGNVAIFFGLSGTGKTTLSADPERFLIGDDEHGWSDEGVFNFEHGCYAKSVALSAETEPEIYAASRRFGATAENVLLVQGREPDYFDTTATENGRISYPLDFIPNAKPDRMVKKQPKNIIMLACDAFGVLPAVSKLSPEQAKEEFLMGYTAKVAGTEQGIKEPKAAFSHCFGAPFMPRKPTVYGDLLAKKIADNQVDCWLVNTGWAGGAYGIGKRMSLKLTRSIISKIHSGKLAKESTRTHSIFGLEVPASIAMPEDSWADKAAYDATARKLQKMFEEHLSR
jgi:phosphoenolpyruvate carboxykinase (ATP)